MKFIKEEFFYSKEKKDVYRKMLGISLLFGLLTVAVPDYVYAGSDTDIRFSRESGFYEESFYLEITGGGQNEDWTLYYTLDGSMPDTTSQQYTEPILIEDVSYKENVYSARRDVSISLCAEELEKFGLGAMDYQIPERPVDKGNVVRVAVYDGQENLVSEEVRVYFIGFQEKTGYDGMMRVSIVTEPDNLFDYETGIYVLGIKYDRYATKERYLVGNFSESGREWERVASVSVFDENGAELLASSAGLRIHGATSRAIPQKGLNLYARDEYEGSSRFFYDLFGNGIGPHKFTLSSGGNDDLVKTKDYIVQTMAAESGLNFATMKMYPCVLFLNGEYWGVYYLSESYNAEYVSDHYGVDKKNVVIVKDGEVTEGNAEDIRLYDEMTDFIANHDMTDEANFQRACELIDIDSFIDYYATETYIGNIDWPQVNFSLWRVRSKENGRQIADGKWRYMLFDTNYYSVFTDPSRDTIGWALEEDEVFASLLQNPLVQQKFRERIVHLGNEIYSVENGKEFFEAWYEKMDRSMQKNRERYCNTAIQEVSPYHVYYMETLKTFFKERAAYMEQYMDYYFGEGG